MMANVILRRALPSFLRATVLISCGVVFVISSAEGAIRNQYLFNEGATADATGRTIIDSVSGANGTVIGPATGGLLPTATANALVLPGGTSAVAPFVNLPNGLASSLTNATFEGWYTISAASNWGRFFDFGSTAGGEVSAPGGGGEGLDYIFYSPQRGTNTNQQRGGMRNNDAAFGGAAAGTVGGAESLADPNIVSILGARTHFALVYNATGGSGTTPSSISVYINGALRATSTTAIQLGNLNDVNTWLGRSNWNGDSNFAGSYSEFRIYDNALNAQEVFNSFVTGPTADPMPPTLEINRSTGTITLINQTPAVQIVGYTLTSAAGSLDPANWRSVTDNYDADSGPPPKFDPDNTWTELSVAGSKVDFSEFDFSIGGTAGGSLGTGGALTSLQLGGPGAWRKSIFEDLVMDVRLADGSALPISTRYIGSLPFLRSDLNFDGAINLADYNIFLTNNLGNFTGLTAAETYPLGDLNGDLQNNRLDFRLFKTDYNIANGAGAFEALTGVPEPSALGLLTLACAALVGSWRRRGSSLTYCLQSAVRTNHQMRFSPVLLSTAVALLAALQGSAEAALRNRYSFNEGATADATGRTIIDSVSGANGTVIGPATGGGL
ncbi:MAG TPA: LamG-like jellyroll fold domain-containing protein, partial [Lacipirellulaceae bacterium]|nr:LamG-like jellyroll fold domain-containing protein [Lacipirellulaceae bacterium]